MGIQKLEYFYAYQNLEIKRADAKLTKELDGIGNQMMGKGLYRSGAHIGALIDNAKLNTERLASLLYSKAEADGLPSEIGPTISKSISEFMLRWRPLLGDYREKIKPNAHAGLLREVERRIAEIHLEISEQCKVSELRLTAFSNEVPVEQAKPTDRAAPSQLRTIDANQLKAEFNEWRLQISSKGKRASVAQQEKFLLSKNPTLTRNRLRQLRKQDAPNNWLTGGNIPAHERVFDD